MCLVQVGTCRAVCLADWPHTPVVCSEAACPKNHVHYYKDRKGHHAELHLVHFKNDSIKGAQRLPLSQSYLGMLALLEQGSAYYSTLGGEPTTTLFYSLAGCVYAGPYFSTISANLLTFGEVRCTAVDFRHIFATLWKDFIASPTTQLHGLTTQQLEEAAAGLMLNSPAAWAISYDDSTVSRGIHTTLALWPKFQAFVKAQHLDKASEEPWDPLTVDLAALALV